MEVSLARLTSIRKERNNVLPKLIAHRGWSSLFPENTVPAFTAATAAGAHEVELDVRVTADGVPVVIHDRTVNRTTDGTGAVDSLTYAQMARFSVTDNYQMYPRLSVPKLDDVLKVIATNTTLNLHIYETGEGAVMKVVRKHLEALLHNGSYLAVNQALAPHIPAAVSEMDVCLLKGDLQPLHQVNLASELGCKRVQFVHTSYTQESVAAARSLGLITNLFFADTLKVAHQAIDWGVDYLLTNRPGELQLELEAAGRN